MSVLIPFLRESPADLVIGLEEQARNLDQTIEIVIFDDGTCDQALTHELERLLSGLRVPARLVSSRTNHGRARARNLLAQQARAEVCLYLDADMRMVSQQFLAQWMKYHNDRAPHLAFGGFVVTGPVDPAFEVHCAMARGSDCLTAQERARDAAKYVYTSNLLVRTEVVLKYPFDETFSGWGWEDVEWALRVSRDNPVTHIDNPAHHSGLDTVEVLMAKYRQSVANFARILAVHPETVMRFKAYMVARWLNRMGMGAAAASLSQRVVRLSVAPVSARAFALRLYRAALYAQVV
ncbi:MULTISPECIES: glycosyltransferase family 2 protein [unclassified Brevundimonas]|uniref:glycosyltransferase family 2 protein n=1 Tax=unclassified Brevundimonas TaxID=2622653 RepID=UPI0025C056AF|nr:MULTISPECIES: glycosyltransferase family A protein [unclassified Brevundimonas]